MTPRAAPAHPGRREGRRHSRRPQTAAAVPGCEPAVDGRFLSLGREGTGATPVFRPMTTAVPETRAAVDGRFLSPGREGTGATPVFFP